MSNKVSINKIDTVTTVYTCYEILEVKIVLFTSCMVTVLLSSDEGSKKIVNLIMINEDYINWNDNDQYLVDWINTKLITE